MAYADAADPIGCLNVKTGQDDPAGLKAAIEGASWQVQAVNWIYEQVTGQNLVESLIAPITGDFAKISQNAAAWDAVAKSLRAVRENINNGVSELRTSWDGGAAVAFETMMVGTWTVALEADAGVANLISMGFQKAADYSQQLCGKILELLTKLINRLIQAACTAWIPVAGWANAVRLVIRCVDIVMMILGLIEAIIQMYEGVKQMVEGIKAGGTSLSQIGEVRSLGDAVNVTLGTGAEAAGAAMTVKEGATAVTEGAGAAQQSATGLRNSTGGRTTMSGTL